MNAVCGRETTSTVRCQRRAGHNHTPCSAPRTPNQPHCSPARMFDVYRPLNHSLNSPASISLSNPDLRVRTLRARARCWQVPDQAVLYSHGDIIPATIAALERRGMKSPRRPIGEKPLSGSSNARSGGDFQKQAWPPPKRGSKKNSHPRRKLVSSF